jgi:hypothetical protein
MILTAEDQRFRCETYAYADLVTTIPRRIGLESNTVSTVRKQ